MSELKVKQARPIAATISVPGDKSISHRAVMLAALSNGPCEITGFLPSEDCLNTVNAFRALGITIEALNEDDDTPWLPEPGGPPGPTRLRVHGRRGILSEPDGPIDCGNSGTTMRLLAGILAGQPFRTELIGDASLSRRPMKRIIEPLTLMGAKLEAHGSRSVPPLVVTGSPRLKPVVYHMPVASAQVKSAVLLAGLSARGRTTVIEPERTRNHTETMLKHFLVKTLREGNSISIYGGQVPESRDFHVPGDISSAAFWIVAAAAQPDAELTIDGVGLNPTRTGVLNVLTRMGACISENVADLSEGEPWGSVIVRGGRLRSTVIGGAEIPNVIDELPVLAVAAALAEGVTVIRDAQELRVKESDRIATVVKNLQAFGVEVKERPDGMEITGSGGEPLRGGRVDSLGDHRIAMAFAVAGLLSDGDTVIRGAECVETSYPGFADDLELFMSREISGGYRTPVINRAPGAPDPELSGPPEEREDGRPDHR